MLRSCALGDMQIAIDDDPIDLMIHKETLPTLAKICSGFEVKGAQDNFYWNKLAE